MKNTSEARWSTPLPSYFGPAPAPKAKTPSHVPACKGVVSPKHCIGIVTGKCVRGVCDEYATAVAGVIGNTRKGWELPLHSANDRKARMNQTESGE